MAPSKQYVGQIRWNMDKENPQKIYNHFNLIIKKIRPLNKKPDQIYWKQELVTLQKYADITELLPKQNIKYPKKVSNKICPMANNAY